MKAAAWRARFERYMAVRQWSGRTVEAYGGELVRFFEFLDREGVASVGGITRDVLEAYRTYLFSVMVKGHPLAPATQGAALSAVKAFVRYLAQEQYLLLDPGEGLVLPRLVHGLPRHLLTEGEVDTLLAAPDVASLLGLRDRAVLEVLYSTGIRNMEALALNTDDVHLERAEVSVHCGKGRKSRRVPLGEEAVHWVSVWLAEGRSQCLPDTPEAALFLSARRRRLRRETLAELVSRQGERAGLRTHVTPHVLRHCCATHMLARGANIRHLQVLLGHASLTTTERYTRVELSDLRAVHRRYHPREAGGAR